MLGARESLWLLSLGFVLSNPGLCAAEDAGAILKERCAACHQGKKPAGGLNLTRFTTRDAFAAEPDTSLRIVNRVREGSMPPKPLPPLAVDQRDQFVSFVTAAVKQAVCAGPSKPGHFALRRLNRDEYAATIRDLLNVHVNAAHALPADGAGGEGFDNAAETLFLSPIHAEKYLEAAQEALRYAARDPKSRKTLFVAKPGPQLQPEAAARKILDDFLPRAFRRPVARDETEHYLALYRKAADRGESFEDATLYALEASLISPHFLFHLESPNPTAAPRPVGSYEMASRLSYFLWGSMPDATLFDLAAKGKLHDPFVLKDEIGRMLRDPKSTEFTTRFVEQWLGTRELGRDIKPDPEKFPQYYDAELQGAIRYEPILFFQELLVNDLSLLNLIDSSFTILTNKLQKHYGLPKTDGISQQPKRVQLPEGSHRGGILGMAGVLAVSSYPHRTSPVLRGKWVLDALLGTPPPPPPPDVPALAEDHSAAPTRTVRERLEEHRKNPVCASCHSRIDPLGFGLENYDVLGKWRTEDAGKPIDVRGTLPDGTSFQGADELRAVLLKQKDLFFQNLTSKLLGYALGRGLTMEDHCTVDAIVAKLGESNYSAQVLIREIVMSTPFQVQEGAAKRP